MNEKPDFLKFVRKKSLLKAQFVISPEAKADLKQVGVSGLMLFKVEA